MWHEIILQSSCTVFTLLMMLNVIYFTICHDSIIYLPLFYIQLWQEQPIRWVVSLCWESGLSLSIFVRYWFSLQTYLSSSSPQAFFNLLKFFFFLFSPWALFQLFQQSVDWFLQFLSIHHVLRSSFGWLHQGQHNFSCSYALFLTYLFHFISLTGNLIQFFLLWPGFFHPCNSFLLPLFFVVFLSLFSPTGRIREE